MKNKVSWWALLVFSLKDKENGQACWNGISETNGMEWKRGRGALAPITHQLSISINAANKLIPSTKIDSINFFCLIEEMEIVAGRVD